MASKKWLWYLAAGCALAATFVAYGQAELLINWVNAVLC
jgi:hypothetical protein